MKITTATATAAASAQQNHSTTHKLCIDIFNYSSKWDRDTKMKPTHHFHNYPSPTNYFEYGTSKSIVIAKWARVWTKKTIWHRLWSLLCLFGESAHLNRICLLNIIDFIICSISLKISRSDLNDSIVNITATQKKKTNSNAHSVRSHACSSLLLLLLLLRKCLLIRENIKKATTLNNNYSNINRKFGGWTTK